MKAQLTAGSRVELMAVQKALQMAHPSACHSAVHWETWKALQLVVKSVVHWAGLKVLRLAESKVLKKVALRVSLQAAPKASTTRVGDLVDCWGSPKVAPMA
jgi:hypothetical protein